MGNKLQIPSAENPFAHRKHWTVNECRKLEAMELLIPGTYELIDGEIVEKMGQNVPHAIACKKLLFALTLVFGVDYVFMPVSVVINNTNNPEPDASVTTRRDTEYLTRGNPTINEMRLVVEVSDTTLWYDCNTKMHLYCGANVPEYWVLDVTNRILIVHRNPTNTSYSDITEYNETQSIAPLSAPNSPIIVANLLP
jgi:Uma2 family endonuclease